MPPENPPPNAYPELPVLDFKRTTLTVANFASYISTTAATTPVRRASYIIFRNESTAGKKGINNNYAGFQADGARRDPKWTPLFAGTCVHAESMTGKQRRFLCFKTWQGGLDLLWETITSRGLYVGGYAHPYANMQINSPDDWPLAYWREWVKGDAHANIPQPEKTNLLKQYDAATKLFP